MRTYRIEELLADVKVVVVDYSMTYRSAFGIFTQRHTLKILPDSSSEVTVRCLNKDCTGRGFDLYSEISLLVHHHGRESSGVMFCNGLESSKHRCTCPTELKYTIRVEYRTDLSAKSEGCL